MYKPWAIFKAQAQFSVVLFIQRLSQQIEPGRPQTNAHRCWWAESGLPREKPFSYYHLPHKHEQSHDWGGVGAIGFHNITLTSLQQCKDMITNQW